jgi:hypothetical protein
MARCLHALDLPRAERLFNGAQIGWHTAACDVEALDIDDGISGIEPASDRRGTEPEHRAIQQ